MDRAVFKGLGIPDFLADGLGVDGVLVAAFFILVSRSCLDGFGLGNASWVLGGVLDGLYFAPAGFAWSGVNRCLPAMPAGLGGVF